jgi:hypothetical protein
VPLLSPVVVRVEPEPEVQDKIGAAVAAFNEQLEAALIDKGYREPK